MVNVISNEKFQPHKISNLKLFTFQSGEKTALVTAILVSQTLYFMLVIEIIPATSKTVPLLGR